MVSISSSLSQIYGIKCKVVGFDSGVGMPRPIDYRDHPEKYRFGDFPLGKLVGANLPEDVELIYGPILEKIPEFLKSLHSNQKIGFISIDLDYYSSKMECFEIFKAQSFRFLPSTILYFDDVNNIDNNCYMGELLAITEFNKKNNKKKICKILQLRNWRIFKNALWIDQMYFLHVLDAEYRNPKNWEGLKPTILENPYLQIFFMKTKLRNWQ